MNQQQKVLQPPQHQNSQPGIENIMVPEPKSESGKYQGSNKLRDKVALITGGDSGIGRSVAIYFAREGADISIVYLNEHSDAEETKRLVEQEGRECFLISGDVGEEEFCKKAVKETVNHFGQLDVLVNNAAEQHVQNSIENITSSQLEQTFRTNFFSYFYMTKEALNFMKQGSSIINTTSVTAYKGNQQLIDYSATKGAIVSFTRSLSQSLINRGIRVNGVAPGPVWTPLIPASFPENQVATFGSNTPMKRPGQPEEIAPCYVFLASNDSSFMTGQVLHPNGGEIVNS